MTGGLIQLVSIGFEDLYLNADPEITYFKMVYKRHTNFSQEPIIQMFSTSPDFGKRLTCSIAKTADLLSNMYVHIEIPELPKLYNGSVENVIDKFRWAKKLGYALINYIELEINGQLVDKLYGDWMNIWSILTIGEERKTEDILIGNIPELYEASNGKKSYKLYVPIEFFFSKNKGLALPLIALHLSDIKIHIEFNSLENVLISSPTHFITIEEYIVHFKKGDILTQNISGTDVNIIFDVFDYKTKRLYYTKYNESIVYYTSTSKYLKSKYKLYNSSGYYVMPSTSETSHIVSYPNVSINSSNLVVNFIYLDNLERKKFATSNHEYLINTLSYSGEQTIYNTHAKMKLSFVNPSKELFWICQFNKIKNGYIKDKFNYTSNLQYSGENIINKTSIHQNGQIRSLEEDKYLYNYLTNYLYHTGSTEEGINTYSYSLDPESYQPKGSCNFSKIDDLTIELTLSSLISYNNPALLRIYNYSYNILRITDGLAGLTFVN